MIAKSSADPVLLTGGNPQIAKGYGEAPVRAYIAAMPGWKRAVGERIDAAISAAVPGLRKAVKWNTPLYGAPDKPGEPPDTWFAAFNCTTKYVKVAWFRGATLDPVPPVGSKQPEVRYLHIHEGDVFDEAQFTWWVEQASRLPGVKM